MYDVASESQQHANSLLAARVCGRVSPYPPMIQLLPNEMLEVIFEHYIATWGTFRATAPLENAWILAQVCGRWRELALSMPRLWNHLPIVRITQNALHTEGFTEYWKEFLHRSGDLPLKLHLSFYLPLVTITKTPYDFLSPFFECSRRWEHLTVSGLMVMQAQVHFEPIRGTLTTLRSLTLNFAETSFDFIASNTFDVFKVAPQLTTVYLHSPSSRFRKSRLNFPWVQLTHYKETGVDMGTFPFVLDLSPHLESLHYRGRNFIWHPADSVFHTSLRHLSVHAELLHKFVHQMDDTQLTIPSLNTLSITASPHHQTLPLVFPVQSFLSRSGCTLKKLAIDVASEPLESEWDSVFQLTPALEALELGGALIPENILQSLIFNERHMNALPYLSSLTLSYHNPHTEDSTPPFIPDGPVHQSADLISQIASSRQTNLFAASHNHLLSVLDRVRIVERGTFPRIRAFSRLVVWEIPGKGYAEIKSDMRDFFLDPADPQLHIERINRACQFNGPPKVTDEILALFTAAHIEEHPKTRAYLLDSLEKIGLLDAVQTSLIQKGWILGCSSDILYINPRRATNVSSDIWKYVANRNTKMVDSILGYEVYQEQKDDLQEIKSMR